MGKFCQFLGELSACDTSLFSFLDDNNASVDFHQTWYVHWYCGDLVWDYSSANFVNF